MIIIIVETFMKNFFAAMSSTLYTRIMLSKSTIALRSISSTTQLKSQDTVISSSASMKSAPAPALALGASGLIPFISAPIYLYQMQEFIPMVGQAQLAYGAVILSFLGGVRWGKLVSLPPPIQPSWNQFSWSVTPSLIAWPALLLPHFQAANLAIVSGLGLCGYLDFKQSGYQPWFKGLRIVLTTVASVSMLSTLLLSLILEQEDKVKQNKSES